MMTAEILEKPEWLTIRPPQGEGFPRVKEVLIEYRLHTVCEEAHCPNVSECWSSGTATFMVLGKDCTRACKFCAVSTLVKPAKPDVQEPRKLAEAIQRMDLQYVVITSVDRDDLPDQGAGHFASCISEIKKYAPDVIIEVLIPDFRGDMHCIQTIVDAKPDVIAHNVETVPRLQKTARDLRAGYQQSLQVLSNIKKINAGIYTKSSLMLGLGETEEEVAEVMHDLRKIGVDILTFGQYLRPSKKHLPVAEYVPPERFEKLKNIAYTNGFLYVAAGPLVRSSYKAAELFLTGVIRRAA